MPFFLKMMIPDFSWVKKITKETWKIDLIAGIIAALIMLPQAAALATLAGMPPEYGVYASIIPVIVAALWGSSWHALSGPNTAVALMLTTALLPFANVGTPLYIGLMMTLTLYVGMIQIGMSFARFGAILNFISPTVVSAISNAVGVLIILSSIWGLLGVHRMSEWSIVTQVNQLFNDLQIANILAVIIGLWTLLSGIIARFKYPKYALLIAMFSGILMSRILHSLFGDGTPVGLGLDLLGFINLSSFVFAAPVLRPEAGHVMIHLIISALSIALVGVMQAAVIANSLAIKSGQHIDMNREIMGQGMSNLAGSFFSSFAGSSSFNRSFAHYDSGTRTPLAAIFSALLIGGIVWMTADIIREMPIPVMAAILIFVGRGLINIEELKKISHSKSESLIYIVTFFWVLFFSLSDAVFIGIFLSVVVYLKNVSRPKFTIEKNEDGYVVRMRGDLFFGSASFISETLRNVAEEDHYRGNLLLNLQAATYFDDSIIRIFERETETREKAGGKLIIQISKDQQEKMHGHPYLISRIGERNRRVGDVPG